MKFGAILLILSSSIFATPLFWAHPNVATSLAEPSLPFGQFVDIRLADIAKESPQNQIWFTGGLVGYFTAEWEAPIWTALRVERRFNFDPADEPRLLRPPVTSLGSLPLAVSGDQHIHDSPDFSLTPLTPPQLVDNTPDNIQVPETPRGIVTVSLVGLAYIFGRTKRPPSTR
jgi:hypothetical protein